MPDLVPGGAPSRRPPSPFVSLISRFARDERGGSALWPQDLRSALIAAACIAAIVAVAALGHVVA